MIKSTLTILLLIGFTTNNWAQKIKIPSKIKVDSLEQKITVSGTNVLINEPVGYTFDSTLIAFQKEDKNYFQISDIANQDFFTTLKKVGETLNDLQASGVKFKIRQKILIEEYFGLIALGYTKEEKELIYLVFGDSTFSVIIIGQFEKNIQNPRENLDLVLSAFYKK